MQPSALCQEMRVVSRDKRALLSKSLGLLTLLIVCYVTHGHLQANLPSLPLRINSR